MEQKVTKHCPYCGKEILAVAKKCKQCGEWLDIKKQEPEKKFINCPICGELIDEGIKQCPHCKENVNSAKSVAKVTPVASADDSRSFYDYYLVEPFFRHYMKFRGRMNRKHYWMTMLIWFLVLVTLGVLFVVQVIQDNPIYSVTLLLMFLWFIATLIPLYAMAVRRMRDADSEPSASAWFFLVLGSPFLNSLTCKQSEDEDIRTDGLEPDEPQSVKFKKNDKIVTMILALLFLFGIIAGPLGTGRSETADEDEMEFIEDNSEEMDEINGEDFDDTLDTDEVIQDTI